jgi:hypothetical protein
MHIPGSPVGLFTAARPSARVVAPCRASGTWLRVDRVAVDATEAALARKRRVQAFIASGATMAIALAFALAIIVLLR